MYLAERVKRCKKLRSAWPCRRWLEDERKGGSSSSKKQRGNDAEKLERWLLTMAGGELLLRWLDVS